MANLSLRSSCLRPSSLFHHDPPRFDRHAEEHHDEDGSRSTGHCRWWNSRFIIVYQTTGQLVGQRWHSGMPWSVRRTWISSRYVHCNLDQWLSSDSFLICAHSGRVWESTWRQRRQLHLRRRQQCAAAAERQLAAPSLAQGPPRREYRRSDTARNCYFPSIRSGYLGNQMPSRYSWWLVWSWRWFVLIQRKNV